MQIKAERLELADGDFIDLGWVGAETGPLVILLHGLNGGLDSLYINGMLYKLQQHGWRAVIMHFRGCSEVPNRLPRSYHSGETGDLTTVVNTIAARESKFPLFAVGYSLGGNVLLKALGEGVLENKLQAAVAISVPFELNKTADHLNTGFAKIYQSRLVNGLKRMHRKKFLQIEDPLEIKNLSNLKTFWQFDNTITAPLHGFKDAEEYYRIASSRQYLRNIKTPTLIIHSRDDPFTTLDSLPTVNEVSDKVTLQYTDKGGHVGFVSSKNIFALEYWLEGSILNYLHAFNR